MDVELLPGESVVWEGRPRRARLWRPTDLVLTPVSVVWTGLAVFWTASASRWFVGVPFVLAGLYFLVGRFVGRAVAARRVRYVLTDLRLIVAGDSHYLRSLPAPVRERDSIAFGGFDGPKAAFRARNPWVSEPSRLPVLWNIADAADVHDLVLTRRAARVI